MNEVITSTLSAALEQIREINLILDALPVPLATDRDIKASTAQRVTALCDAYMDAMRGTVLATPKEPDWSNFRDEADINDDDFVALAVSKVFRGGRLIEFAAMRFPDICKDLGKSLDEDIATMQALGSDMVRLAMVKENGLRCRYTWSERLAFCGVSTSAFVRPMSDTDPQKRDEKGRLVEVSMPEKQEPLKTSSSEFLTELATWVYSGKP